jgi:formylglycine-generating enzyme required for sulfatase activity
MVIGLVLAGMSSSVSTAPQSPEMPNVRVNPVDGLRYVLIRVGTFRMGCSEGDRDCATARRENPPHLVTLTKNFWMGQTEVTVGAYKRFATATGRGMPPEPTYSARSSVTFEMNPGWKEEQQPIVNVNWHDSVAYCQWIGGRLPTEAEWEYAARAGERSARYGRLEDIAWYMENSGRERLDLEAMRAKGDNLREIIPRAALNGNTTHNVAQKQPNRWGLYDMLGNAHEWVQDWEGPYSASPATDPVGPATGDLRIVRGSEYFGPPWLVTLSLRTADVPDHGDGANGFRCVSDDRQP